MNRESGPAILAEVLCDIIRYTFSADEDEHFRIQSADMVEVFNELRTLLEVSANLNNLLNVVISCKLQIALVVMCCYVCCCSCCRQGASIVFIDRLLSFTCRREGCRVCYCRCSLLSSVVRHAANNV